MTTSQHTGRYVTLTRTLAPNFPGWGAPDYADYLVPCDSLAGQRAKVTGTNSHGSAPFLRYNLVTDDGHRIIDAHEGTDFTWGAPQS